MKDITTVTFSGENKPVKFFVNLIVLELPKRTYSRLSYLLNNLLSKSIWNAVQTHGAAVNVLFTGSSPYEKPVLIG